MRLLNSPNFVTAGFSGVWAMVMGYWYETWPPIDMLHKSHKALVPYPTMHLFVAQMCTCVHISVSKWYIVGYLSNALWYLCIWVVWIYFLETLYCTEFLVIYLTVTHCGFAIPVRISTVFERPPSAFCTVLTALVRANGRQGPTVWVVLTDCKIVYIDLRHLCNHIVW